MVYSRKIIYKNKNLRKRSRKGGGGEKVSLTKVTPKKEAQSILKQVLQTNDIDNHEEYLKKIVKIENDNEILLNTNQFFSKCYSNNELLGRYNNYVMTSGQITKEVYDNVFSNNDNIVVHLSNNLNLAPLFKYNNSSEKEFLNEQHMDILTPMNINKKESYDKAREGNKNKAYFFDLAMYGCIPSYWTNILLERICKKIKHDDRQIIKKFSEVCLDHRYNQFAFNKIKLEYITLNEENIQSMQEENYDVDNLLSIKNHDKIMTSVTFREGKVKPITKKLVEALNQSPKVKRYILFIILIIIPNIDNPDTLTKEDFIDKITKILELKKTILEFDPNSFYYTSFLKDIFGVEGDRLVEAQNVSFLQTFVKTTLPPGLDGSIIDLFDGIFFLTYDLFEATNFLYTFNTQVNESIATKNSMIVNKPELTQYVNKIKELIRYVDDETINFIPKNGLPDTIICDMEADDMALVLLIDYFRKRHKKNNVSESEILPLNIYLQIENIEELKKKEKFNENKINGINRILEQNGVKDTREYDVEKKFKLVIDNINLLRKTDKNLSLLLEDDDNLRVDKFRIEHVIRKTWIPFYTTTYEDKDKDEKIMTFYKMMKEAGDLRRKVIENPNHVDAAKYLEEATRITKQAREIKTEELNAAAAAGGKKRKTKNKKTKKHKKRRRHTKRRR